MDLRDLQKIGLTEGEIKVYDALLELGECTKTNLAKKSKISPSNIYDVTNRLIEKGIISKVEKNGVAHFSPTNPRHILGFIEQKEKELLNEKSFVNQILPSLLMKFSEQKKKTNVELFIGWSGLKTVFDDYISECQKGDENQIVGASKGEDEKNEKQVDAFFTKYSKIRDKKGIKTRIIFNADMKGKERMNFFKKSKQYQVKFLDQKTPAEIMTYKDKTCINLILKKPISIRITSEEVNRSFRQYFELMWALAKN